MSDQMLIFNARVYLAGGILTPGWVLIGGGRIACVGQGEPPEGLPIARSIDGGGKHVLPGFIDLHIHGSAGYEVMDCDPNSILGMARFLVTRGVTGFLPTTLTAAHEHILAAVQAVKHAAEQPLQGRAAILGMHLEGPYINPQRCGAQDPSQIRKADRREFSELVSTGMIRLVALAPELPENLWLITACEELGITTSAGHTSTNLEQISQAAALGLSQVTHLFNAMSPFNHRELGTVGAALALDGLNCEMICDNVHVHPLAQKVALRSKGVERIILISDALRCAGLPDGSYIMDQQEVFKRDCACYLENGSLAGSVISIDQALKNILANSGLNLEQGWCMSSLNAAKAIHLDDKKGSIAAGKDADLVLLDDDLAVCMTIVAGKIVYEVSE